MFASVRACERACAVRDRCVTGACGWVAVIRLSVLAEMIERHTCPCVSSVGSTSSYRQMREKPLDDAAVPARAEQHPRVRITRRASRRHATAPVVSLQGQPRSARSLSQ